MDEFIVLDKLTNNNKKNTITRYCSDFAYTSIAYFCYKSPLITKGCCTFFFNKECIRFLTWLSQCTLPVTRKFWLSHFWLPGQLSAQLLNTLQTGSGVRHGKRNRLVLVVFSFFFRLKMTFTFKRISPNLLIASENLWRDPKYIHKTLPSLSTENVMSTLPRSLETVAR